MTKPSKSYSDIIKRLTELTDSGDLRWEPEPKKLLEFERYLKGTESAVAEYNAKFDGNILRLVHFGNGEIRLYSMYDNLTPRFVFPDGPEIGVLSLAVNRQILNLDNLLRSLWPSDEE